MKDLTQEELLEINGGLNITGTVVNAFTNAGKFIYSLGQGLGGALRRIGGRNLCPLK